MPLLVKLIALCRFAVWLATVIIFWNGGDYKLAPPVAYLAYFSVTFHGLLTLGAVTRHRLPTTVVQFLRAATDSGLHIVECMCLSVLVLDPYPGMSDAFFNVLVLNLCFVFLGVPSTS